MFGIWREGQLFLYRICIFCIFDIFGMFLYLEGGPTIPLQDLYFWYLRGGYCFSCFSFGVALLILYVAKYGLNGLSPATGRHTYIGGTW